MDLLLDFFTECGFKRLYETGIYFGFALTLVTAFSYVMLGVAAPHHGFLKTLVGLAFYVLTVAAVMFPLYAVDEGLLLKRECSIARVDAASFVMWAVALLTAFSINQLFFGKRLRENGYYKGLHER